MEDIRTFPTIVQCDQKKKIKLKMPPPFLKDVILHWTLKCRRYSYHSVIIFHLQGLCNLVFFITPVNAVFFWSKCLLLFVCLWILHLLKTFTKGSVRCARDSRENSGSLILALTILLPLTTVKRQVPPPFACSFSFHERIQNRLTIFLCGDLKFIKLF